MENWQELLKNLENEFLRYENYLESREKIIQFIREMDERILRASLHVTSPPDVEGMLSDIIRMLKEIVLWNADGCYAYLLETPNRLVLQASLPEMPERYRVLDVDNSAIGIAVKSRLPILVDNVRKQPPYDSLYKEFMDGATSLVAVPLADPTGYVMGVMGAESLEEAAFDESDTEVLGLAAGQSAIVLSHGRWQDTYSWLLRHLEKSVEGSLSLEEALDGLLEKAIDLVGPSEKDIFGQVLLVEGDELVVHSTNGPEPIGVRVKISESVSGLAVERRGVVATGNLAEEEPYASRYKEYLGKAMSSEMAAPTMLGEEVIGVINLESPQRNAFSENQQQLIQVFANQAALAVSIVRQQDVVRRRLSQDQSIALMVTLGGISSNIVHEINSGVSPVEYKLDEIRDQHSDVLEENPELEEGLNFIRKAVEELSALPEQLKTYRFSAPGPMDLNALLKAEISELKNSAPKGVNLRSEFDSALPEIISSRLLLLALSNMVRNSFDHLVGGGTLTISTRFFSDTGERKGGIANWIEIHVKDTGPGVREEDREKIFELGYSTKGSTGFGLWWARSYIEMLGGSLRYKQPPEGEGSLFIVRLPIDASPSIPRQFFIDETRK